MTRRPTNRCKHCGRRREHEFRGVIAVLVIVLTFGLAYIQVLRGVSESLIPPWAGVVLGTVITFYFMGRIGEVMRDKTNDTKDMMKELSGGKEANRR